MKNIRPYAIIIYIIFLSTISNSVFSEDKQISIIGTGDIMLGTDFPEEKKLLPKYNGRELFINVLPILKQGDIVFGNLEQVLLDGGICIKNTKAKHIWAFRSPVKYKEALESAFFNVMNLGNNHTWDFDIHGLNSTIRALDSVNIQHTGGLRHIAEFQISGQLIAVIGFNTNYHGFDLRKKKDMTAIIRQLDSRFDIIVVSFHGGTEGENAVHTINQTEYLGKENRGNVVLFAHTVIDNGADLVIGHGPHVPRAIELYKHKLIAYSLGNFCTYGSISIQGRRGLAPILKVIIDGNGNFISGKIYSFKQRSPGYPVRDRNMGAAKLIKKLSESDFPDNLINIDMEGNLSLK